MDVKFVSPLYENCPGMCARRCCTRIENITVCWVIIHINVTGSFSSANCFVCWVCIVVVLITCWGNFCILLLLLFIARSISAEVGQSAKGMKSEV